MTSKADFHAVLLGDSIFDNAAYTQGAPDVVTHLRAALRPGRAELLAQDGSVCDEIRAQLPQIPGDASHLFLSAGGNDAIGASDVLWQSATTVGEGLFQVAQAASEFETRYARLLDAALEKELPLVVCTIYNPSFSDAAQQAVGVAGLCFWNDAIIRQARARGLPLLDLRAVCTEPRDFSNEIEPSSQGGLKIARAIAELLDKHEFLVPRTVIYPMS